MGAFQCGDDAFELSQFVGGADGLVVIYGENDGALLCGKVGMHGADARIIQSGGYVSVNTGAAPDAAAEALERYKEKVAPRLEQAAKLIAEAQKPLIYCGGGVILSGAESELLAFLMEFSDKKVESKDSTLLNGPVVNAEGRTDVVTSQQQVDDLLESLGF